MLTSFNVHIWKTRTRHLTWREVTHALWACALFPVQELKGHWLMALHLSALLHRRSFPCHDFSGAAPADEADKAPKDKCLLTPAGRSWHCLPKQCPVLTDCFFFFFFLYGASNHLFTHKYNSFHKWFIDHLQRFSWESVTVTPQKSNPDFERIGNPLTECL